MKLAPQSAPKPEVSSLLPSPDRVVLCVSEVAKRWRVTEQHVINLLEDGRLNGFDVTGREQYIRVPASAVQTLALRFKVDPQIILGVIEKAKPSPATKRAHWRVPVKEGFEAFMKENHSFADGS